MFDNMSCIATCAACRPCVQDGNYSNDKVGKMGEECGVSMAEHGMEHHATRCDVMDAMRWDAMRRGAMRCNAMPYNGLLMMRMRFAILVVNVAVLMPYLPARHRLSALVVAAGPSPHAVVTGPSMHS